MARRLAGKGAKAMLGISTNDAGNRSALDTVSGSVAPTLSRAVIPPVISGVIFTIFAMGTEPTAPAPRIWHNVRRDARKDVRRDARRKVRRERLRKDLNVEETSCLGKKNGEMQEMSLLQKISHGWRKQEQKGFKLNSSLGGEMESKEEIEYVNVGKGSEL